jgi:hypothetical protein
MRYWNEEKKKLLLELMQTLPIEKVCKRLNISKAKLLFDYPKIKLQSEMTESVYLENGVKVTRFKKAGVCSSTTAKKKMKK